jgi:cyclopropane fatty-acyl-phospholipid synthase-like methyltransferase
MIPEIKQKLESGIKVADVGCGNGRAIIKMATTYPNSSYIGLDIHEPSVELADKKAEEAGLENIVSFKVTNISKDLGGKYDLITSFDVIHDLVNPKGALRVIRESLNPDGAFLLLEYKSSDDLAENFNPVGAMRYGFSVLFCLTTSLHEGGEGLGTMGMSPAKVKELCEEAGFSKVEKVQIEDPFNTLFLIKP